MRPEDLIGKQLGRYTVTKLLGRGGMAAVFEAEDSILRRPVALKVLYGQFLGDAGLVERFRREAIIAARLEHPSIVPIYDVGEADGVVYIAMKLLSGRSLQDELLTVGDLDPERVVAIVRQVAAALDYAHGRGVVHRDIKPGNVMLDDNGGVILTDFGIAKSLDAPGMTSTGVIVGTPDYMSPEQIDSKQGPLDGRADIYALAVMAYRMLTGARPFDGSTTDVLLSHLTRLPEAASQRNPHLPPSIDRVLSQGMAKSPLDRPASAGVFARDLDAALGEATAVGAATPPPGALRGAAVIPAVAAQQVSQAARRATAAQPRPARRRTPAWPILALIAVIIMGVLGGAVASVLNFRGENSAGATTRAQTLVSQRASETALSGTLVAQFAAGQTTEATATRRATASPTAGAATAAAADAPTATESGNPSPTPAPSGGVVPPATAPVVVPTARPAAPQPTRATQPTQRPPAPTRVIIPPTITQRVPAPPTSPPPTPAPVGCDGPLVGGFGALWRGNADVAAAVGCPTSPEAPAESSLQYFEGGMMFWWKPNDMIYVLYGGAAGSWETYANPNDPSYDQPREQAPSGFIEPVRGFGTLWHTYPGIRSAMGWGTSPEYPMTGVVQFFPRGMMIWAPELENRNARIWVLTYDGGWTRYDDPTR